MKRPEKIIRIAGNRFARVWNDSLPCLVSTSFPMRFSQITSISSLGLDPTLLVNGQDQDVALRWLRIFHGQRMDEHLAVPTTNAVDTLANNAERIKTIRLRLSDPSWFMKALCEPIARLANFQDNVTGHFWEGRFKAQAITDEAGLLACSMYVGLNPISAAMATIPEESRAP